MKLILRADLADLGKRGDLVEVADGYARNYLIPCLLYTSDAADERSSVDLGGRRIIKKKTYTVARRGRPTYKILATRDEQCQECTL